MTQEERKDYCREYRREGFGRLADRRYRLLHADELRRRDRERKRRKSRKAKHHASD